MKNYKIIIEIEDYEEVYNQIDSFKKAQEIAEKNAMIYIIG